MKLFRRKPVEESHEERLTRLLNEKVSRTERKCAACHRAFKMPDKMNMCVHCEVWHSLNAATAKTMSMLGQAL